VSVCPNQKVRGRTARGLRFGGRPQLLVRIEGCSPRHKGRAQSCIFIVPNPNTGRYLLQTLRYAPVRVVFPPAAFCPDPLLCLVVAGGQEQNRYGKGKTRSAAQHTRQEKRKEEGTEGRGRESLTELGADADEEEASRGEEESRSKSRRIRFFFFFFLAGAGDDKTGGNMVPCGGRRGQ